MSPGIFKEQVAAANQRAYFEVQKAKEIGNGDVFKGKKSIDQFKIDEKRKKIDKILSEVKKLYHQGRFAQFCA